MLGLVQYLLVTEWILVVNPERWGVSIGGSLSLPQAVTD